MLILLPPSEKKAETTKPTPAIAVYQGVLYQALGWPTLSAAARTRGEITRWLLQSRAAAKSPEDLYAIVSEKYPCALTPSDGVAPWVLEVIAV